MTPDRHARIKEVFIAALELEPAQRSKYLDEACRDDGELRREVDSLLGHAASQTTSETVEDQTEPAPRFQAGDVFVDRYRIVSLLGRGGMGEVYRADDLTLKVPVALKLLLHSSPERMGILLNEVRTARRITHPAVCRVFDVGGTEGQQFFSMEYIAGEDMRSLLHRIGRLPVDKVREIGIQLAEGLAAAHAEGVLHRDLKPSNIMLDQHGNVKITDFGVATTPDAVRRPGLVGTPAYMAPEQLRGQPCSEQSDLYALGLILYEALTGKVAHDADSVSELLVDRSSDSIVRPSHWISAIDPQLERIVLDLLQADPAKRPRSAAEVAKRLAESKGARPSVARNRPISALRVALVTLTVAVVAATFLTILRSARAPRDAESTAVSADARTKIAVLPFENVGNDPANATFVEGVHSEIIAELSMVHALRVVARSSVQAAHDLGNAPRGIADELGAKMLAEGRVSRLGDQLRVSVALVDPSTDLQVWSKTYDRKLTADNLFAIESDVAMQIANALGAELTESEKRRIAHDRVTSLDNYEIYQEGRHAWRRYTEQGYEQGASLFRQVIDRDAGFAPAYAGLASVYAVGAANGWMPASEAYPLARRAAREALKLDPSNDEALVALGLVAFEFDWDWAIAEKSFRQAIELNASSAWAERAYGKFLSSQRRFDEARAAALKALDLAPGSPIMVEGLAWRAYEARNFVRAVTLGEATLRYDPEYADGYKILAFAEIARGNASRAVELLLRHVELAGRSPQALAALGYGYARAGRPDDAHGIASELETLAATRFVDSGQLALLPLALGDHERALRLLAEAVDRRADPSIWLAVDPKLDPLRTDPRFQELVRRVGLPTN